MPIAKDSMPKLSHTPRNISKAKIRCEQRNGRLVLFKDYRSSRGLMKWYGRLTLRKEFRAYQRLRGVTGIPTCFGLKKSDLLELEYVNAVPLSKMKPGTVPANVFDRLEEIISAMHARGIANTDIHRSNVLVSETGEVYLIDFSHALIARDAHRPGLFVRLAMELDRYACARIRARYLRQPAPTPLGLFGLLYRAGSTVKKILKRITHLARRHS